MPGEGTAFIAATCYSLSYVLLRKGQSDSELPDHGLFPILFLSFITLGLTLAVCVFTGVIRITYSSHWQEALLYTSLSGVVGTWLGRMALYGSISYIGATRGVVLKSIAPLVTLVIAFLLLGERLGDWDTPGLVSLLAGIGLVLLDRQSFLHRGFLNWLRRGILLGLMAAVLQGIGHALRKLGTLHPIGSLLSALVDVGAAWIGYSLWLIFTARFRSVLRAYTRSYNPYLLTAGLLSSAGVLLFFVAVGSAPVSTVSVIIGTEPVLVAIFSTLFLKKMERLTLLTILASLLVATGVILTSLDQHPKETRKSFAGTQYLTERLALLTPAPVHFNQTKYYVKRG